MGNRTYYGKTVRGTLTESTETTYNAANQPIRAVEFDGNITQTSVITMMKTETSLKKRKEKTGI
ncbi:MAG: hypothetical protein PUA70_00450 [Oribacterium sp.]|nr:hypothetical protein [Oribacterium sp.]